MARKSILMLLVSACLVAASSLFLLVDSLSDGGAKPTADHSSASTPTPTTNSSASKQHAEVEVSLPPVVQVGAKPAVADEASAVVLARLDPPAPGRELQLEGRGPHGWAAVADGVQDSAGTVRFLVSQADQSTAFRVTGDPFGDFGALKSKRVDNPWKLTFADDFDALLGWATDPGTELLSGAVAISPGGSLVSLTTPVPNPSLMAARVQFAPGATCSVVLAPAGSKVAGVAKSMSIAHVARRDRLRAEVSYWLPKGPLASWRGVAQGLATDNGWSNGFHVLSVERTDKAIVFSIDGQEFSHTSQGLGISSAAISLSCEPGPGAPMLVDWVRVWQS